MMASFRLGPLRSPQRVRHCSPLSPPVSIESSQLQGSLEQVQHSPPNSQTSRSSGKSSPSRGRCVKEYEEQLQQLQHENFNLKLRVFLLEERVGKALGRGDAAEIIKSNIELKVDNETLKKSLANKNELLTQASTAIEELENQQKSALSTFTKEKLALNDHLKRLQKELADAEEATQCNAFAHMDALPDESTDLYAQAFGSFVLNPLQPLQPASMEHSSSEQIKQLLTKIDELHIHVEELNRQTAAQNQVVERLSKEIDQSQEHMSNYRQTIASLEKEIGEHQMAIPGKERVIEEQNKILVEVKITLDQREKQIEDLQGTLNQREKRIDDVEKSLSEVGRTLQGFATDSAKKEQEKLRLETEVKKKEQRIKDLTDQLKEAHEMTNKVKWQAQNCVREEEEVKSMAEEENERLWAELEEKKRLNLILQQDSSQIARELQQQVQQLTAELNNVKSAAVCSKEVALLRQRLGDSMQANDLLRTRLEEMTDFLEEVLAMSDRSLMNLSSWSAKKRQALQHSILQSRELSRTLSQSLMLSATADDDKDTANCDNSRQQPEDVSVSSAVVNVVDQLRIRVAQLQEQVKQRDCEIAFLHLEASQKVSLAAAAAAAAAAAETKEQSSQANNVNKTMNTTHPRPPISSTPYHRKLEKVMSGDVHSASFISPVTKKAESKNASESEGWSEPDRSVSSARMGLALSENNSIASILLKKSSSGRSSRDSIPVQSVPANYSDSSVSCSGAAGRRSRSDPHDLKSLNRLRALEQENHSLRSQLTQVVDNLRSTWREQQLKGDPMMNDSELKEDSSTLLDVSHNRSDVNTAQYIIDALQNRLYKMKEMLKRREQRLRETKDQVTQLEFKVKERYFLSCQDQTVLKDTQQQLKVKSEALEQLNVRLEEMNGECQSMAVDRECARKELQSVEIKAQMWEKSFNDSQQSMRQVVSDMRAQQDQLLQSKMLLEQQVQLLGDDLKVVQEERGRLQDKLKKTEHNEQCRAELKRSQRMESSVTSQNNCQFQRQLSQMSDYVSDQYFENTTSLDGKLPVVNCAGQNHSRPSSLHLSPDLGIESDPGRFSSLERTSVKGNNTKSSTMTVVGRRSSDALLTTESSCPNCPKLQKKYAKAKQELKELGEKLQKSNLSKEKFDQALRKQAGLSRNTLCQARGIVEKDTYNQ